MSTCGSSCGAAELGCIGSADDRLRDMKEGAKEGEVGEAPEGGERSSLGRVGEGGRGTAAARLTPKVD